MHDAKRESFRHEADAHTKYKLSNAFHMPVVEGDFFTDGQTFLVRLRDTPLCGTGRTLDAAFADLMRVLEASGDFAGRLREMAQEQRSERLRASLLRMTAWVLIVFGVLGGRAGRIGGSRPAGGRRLSRDRHTAISSLAGESTARGTREDLAHASWHCARSGPHGR